VVEIDQEKKDFLNKKYEELTDKGYRVLAVAYKGVRDAEIASRDLEKSINDLVLSD